MNQADAIGNLEYGCPLSPGYMAMQYSVSGSVRMVCVHEVKGKLPFIPRIVHGGGWAKQAARLITPYLIIYGGFMGHKALSVMLLSDSQVTSTNCSMFRLKSAL